MATLVIIVRIVVVLFILRMLFSMVMRRRMPATGGPVRKSAERIGGTLRRDPQCGTFVPEDRAVVSGRGADAQYFCSGTCRDAWLAAHAQT